MFGRRSLASDIFSVLLVILIISIIGLVLFLYVGFIALAIFLGIGICIAAVYSIVVYIRSLVAAAREVGGGGVHSLGELLKNWARLIYLASGYAFKENLAVAANALEKSHRYKFISPRRWMWFIVAPAAIVMGTAVIVCVIILQVIVFIVLAAAVILAMAVYLAVAFLFACGYAVVCSVKNTSKDGVKDMFAFNFTLSADFAGFASAVKQYFSGLWTTVSNVWSENLSMGQSNKSYASGYKIIQPQYVFLVSSFIALPFICVLYAAVLIIVAVICFVPVAIVNLIWTAISKLISKFR